MSGEKKNGKVVKSFWVCWRPKDAMDGMQNLTPAEELAYRRILDMIFSTDDRLYDDDQTLAWSTRAGRQWKAVKAGLITKGKIACEGGFIRNQRATDTCIETRNFRAQKSAAAVASHQSPKRLKNKETGSADADATAPAGAGTYAEPDAPARQHIPKKEGLRPSTDGGLFGDDPPKPKGRPKPPKAEPKPDPHREVRDASADKLSDLTGKPSLSFQNLLRGWIRDTGGDAAAVAGFVDEAARVAPGHAVRHIFTCVQRYSKAAAAPVPETAGGKVVAGVVEECCEITGADCEAVWPGFTRVVAEALASGGTAAVIDAAKQAKPFMRHYGTPGGIQNAGWFRTRISSIRMGAAA